MICCTIALDGDHVLVGHIRILDTEVNLEPAAADLIIDVVSQFADLACDVFFKGAVGVTAGRFGLIKLPCLGKLQEPL